VVAPTGPGAYPLGVTNEVVIPDLIVNPAVLLMAIVAAGAPGDIINAEVACKVL
jgi:hypothetical protein